MDICVDCWGRFDFPSALRIAKALEPYNIMYLESNYWKYTHQYPYFVNNVPKPENGHVKPPELPGIGAEIRQEIFRNGAAITDTLATL